MKLNIIAEAKYVSGGKGSLEWLLKNFFVEYSTQEMEDKDGNPVESISYETKPSLRITARGAQVVGITTFADDYELLVKHSSTGKIMTQYAKLDDIVVQQLKTLWPSQSP